jgi:uncharacterized protein
LSAGNFAGLTISGQLAIVEEVLRRERACLIGSSMGGYLAALDAARHTEIAQLVLMAPAFHFAERWAETLGPAGVAAWRETGQLRVFHYATGREEAVGYALLEDAKRHPAEPDFAQPALVFHGLDDAVIPIAYSRRYAANHAHVQVREMQSGHELTDVASQICDEALAFLVAPPPS